ncbi:MAG: helix-turn-helix domain-containing protein [Calditrichaeota bacterium]|nr:MAG: helix-turn-helix domain-containing protein [Calditrichota bacterium]
MADMLERSLSYLCEQCYSHYGMSLHQLIETVRLEQAVELLAQDGHKIEHVRRQVGYAYTKTFRRAFKNRLQLTPQQLRAQLADCGDCQQEIENILEHLWQNTVKNDL